MNSSRIVLKVPAPKIFDLPEGVYPGVLANIKSLTKQTKQGPQNWIRLVFELQVPGFNGQIPCAGRNFLLELNAGSDLRNFLEGWLGDGYFADRSNSDFDFDTLLHKPGNVCLSHWQSETYNKPHVRIDWVHAVQTLAQEQLP
jgi:hypothetical protein